MGSFSIIEATSCVGPSNFPALPKMKGFPEPSKGTLVRKKMICEHIYNATFEYFGGFSGIMQMLLSKDPSEAG